MVVVGLVLAMSFAAAEAESGTPEAAEGQPVAADAPADGDPVTPVETDGETPGSEDDGGVMDGPADPAVADPAAETAGGALETGGGDLEQRIKRSRRNRTDDILSKSDDADYGDPGVAPGDATFVGAERPAVLQPRWPGGALALGAFVGFGAGYYYAGVPRWGLVFTLVDAALIGGFVASTVVLNNLVIEHDFNQGKSLARNERDFTKREQRWYTASIIFALAGVGARAFQAFGGLRAARRTNATLQSFSFVPLGDGGAMELQLSW